MNTSWWTDMKNVVWYKWNFIQLQRKIKLASKWIELDNIILSEGTQNLKGRCDMFFTHILASNLRICVKSPALGMGYLSSSCWSELSPRPPKQCRLLSLLWFSTRAWRKTLLLKKPHTWIIKHGEIKLVLTKKLLYSAISHDSGRCNTGCLGGGGHQ